MATIPLLQTGATAGQIIDTINALIAEHNEGQNPVSVSYEDLTHKPKLNGVVISGDMTTQSARIKITETEDYTEFEAINATKDYADEAKGEAVEAAQSAVREQIDSKLDKDLGNIEHVDSFPGGSLIPIVTERGTKKTTLQNVQGYVTTQASAERSAVDPAIEKYRRILSLEGEQNGKNVTYTVVGGYKTGTSCLYFNGQLITPNKDYDETDTYTITMLTYIPRSDDTMTFKALPLE